jgi:hypothetical protein
MPERNRVNDFYQEFGHIKSRFKKAFIKTVLYSRIAAGLENHEEGCDKTGFDGCDPVWKIVNDDLLVWLAERNPKRASIEAVNLILLPESGDPKQEAANKWIRTTGLTFFGQGKNIDMLDIYLNRGRHREKLSEIITNNMETGLESFDGTDKFYYPQGFTTIQSIYLGWRLSNSKHFSGGKLYLEADTRRTQPDIVKATKILQTVPGCEYLADIL